MALGPKRKISNYTYPPIEFITLDPGKPFGPQLKPLRVKNKIGCSEIAHKLEMDPGNLYNWEVGRKWIGQSLTMAIKYMQVFNVQEVRMKLTRLTEEE